MIRTIARKEFTELVRDGRFRLAGLAVAVLLAAAFVTGWRQWRDTSLLHADARRATRAHWLAQPPKTPHAAAHYGVYAVRPEPPLALVDRGVTSYTGAYTWLEAHRQNAFRGRPAQDATAAARFGEWTAAGVLQLIMPLLIVVLVAPAFAGERDRGTLRQLASLGVPPGRLALGKAAGTCGALALLLVPAAVAGAGALVLAGPVDGAAAASDAAQAAGDTALRVGLLALAYLAYFALFVGVALAVSARARSARTALAVLLAFWAVNALGAPPVAAALARARHPTPTALAFNAGVERAIAGAPGGPTKAQRDARFRDSVLAAYHVTSVAALPVNFAGLALEAGERDGDRVFDAAYGGLARGWRAQEGVRQIAALAAPLLAVRSLSMALAGTDVAQQLAFEQAAEGYRRALITRIDVIITSAARTGDGFVQTAGPEAWASVPAFRYTAPTVGRVLAEQGGSAAALGAWVVFAVGAAAWATRRFPVEGGTGA